MVTNYKTKQLEETVYYYYYIFKGGGELNQLHLSPTK